MKDARHSSYIKLYRSALDHWTAQEKPFDKFHAWVWLLANANYKPRKVEIRGKIVEIQRGQLVTSMDALADAWGWDRKKVMRYITLLKKDGMIEKSGTTHGTILTIENYAFYQGHGTTHGTTDGTTHGTTDGTHLKNIKNNINPKERARAREGEGPATKKWREIERREAEKRDAGRD